MKRFIIIIFSMLFCFTALNANEFITTLESRIHTLVNAERIKFGLKPLKKNAELAVIARGHSQDMADRDYTGHVTPEGLSPTDRAKKSGFKTTIKRGNTTRIGVGENIYETQSYMEEDGVKTPYLEKVDKVAEKAITGWMNSPGHRKNILNPDYTMEGTGAAVSKEKEVKVTQMFF